MGGKENYKRLDSFMREVEAMEEKANVVNYDGVRRVNAAYDIAVKMFGEKSVRKELHKPFKSSGSVSIKAKAITCNDPEAFVEMVELGDNFEIYPKVDGSVQIDIAFSGLVEL